MQRSIVRGTLVVVFIAGALALAWFAYTRIWTQSSEPIHILAWTGYEEDEFIKAFERETGLKAQVRTFVGGDQMFALMSASKGDYDLVVVDPEYVSKLVDLGRLAPLNPADYDLSDYYVQFQNFPTSSVGGKLYAVPVRFGANGMVYNTNHLSAQDVSSYSILFDEKVRGRVGIWDWYLPSMGVLSRSLSNSDPYNLAPEKFQALTDRMVDLRGRVRAIHATPPEMMASLASGDTWVVPAAGEWVAAVLRAQGKPIDWVVPKEGGIMWIETLAIPSDAPNPEGARRFIQWATTAKAQALLSQRDAYHSNVPNRQAYKLLTPAQRRDLHVMNEQEGAALIDSLSIRALPRSPDEATWQSAWQNFKATTLSRQPQRVP